MSTGRAEHADPTDRFDHAWWAMATIDLAGRFLRVNEPLCRVVGRDRDDLVGRSVFDVVPADLLTEEIAAVDLLLAGERQVVELARRLRFATGEEWEGTLFISVVRDEATGRPDHLHLRLVDPPERRRPPERIARHEGDFPLSLDQMRVGIAVVGLDGVALSANPALCALTGRTEDELRRTDLLSMTHPDDAHLDVSHGSRAWAGEFDSYTIEKRLVRPDGSVVWVQQEITFVRDEGGDLLHLVGQLIDITDRKRAEVELAESRQRYIDLLDRVPVGVVEADAAGRVISANPAAAAIVGDPAMGPGFDAAAIVHADDWEHVVAVATPNIRARTDYHVEFRIVRPDGGIRWIRSDAHPNVDLDGRFLGLTGTWLDVTELKATEQLLREQATHDPLTGLANRVLFFEVLGAAISRARRSGRTLGVLFIDLDGFKAVNDSAGHRAGDAVLAEIAGRLRVAVRGGDLVARVGGDEFTVVCEDLDPADPAGEARQVGERLIEAVRGEPTVAGDSHRVGASVGIAVWTPGVGADELVGAADRAVYAAKRAGRGRVAFA